jgi:hypothetical protein
MGGTKGSKWQAAYTEQVTVIQTPEWQKLSQTVAYGARLKAMQAPLEIFYGRTLSGIVKHHYG